MKRALVVGHAVGALLAASTAHAANHYVRAGASGSKSGDDWTNAYSALPPTLVRGDTYYIAGGSYAGYAFDDDASGTTIITIRKATAGEHGTDVGWQDAFGDATATFGSIEFSTSHWLFDGVTGGGPGSWRSGFGFEVDCSTSSPGVSVLGVTGITIRHLAVIGPHPAGSGGAASTDGFYFRNAVGENVDFTLSYYFTESLGLAPFSAIPIASAMGSHFVAEYGYVGSYYGDSGSHSELASIWSEVHGTVTFRYSIFGYVFSTGGIMWNNEDHRARLDVYGNVFWRDPTLEGYDNCCNGLIGGWSNFDFFNVHVYNNSFVNIPQAEVLSSFPTGSTNEARNNLFYAVASPGAGSGVWDQVTHNHFISTDPIGTQTSTSAGDPFVDLENLDFRITASTPTGTPLPSPYDVDMYGNVRGADGVWDRGAFEFGTRDLTAPAPPANVRVD